MSGDETTNTNLDDATQVDPRPHPGEEDYTSLLRVSLWSVIDGHGGGCVATYASEVLLPHIAASVARALKCTILDRGICIVNGQLRDANALDLDGLIRSSDRSKVEGTGNIDVANPNSIHYRSPSEDSESEGEGPGRVDHTTSEEGEHDHEHGRRGRTSGAEDGGMGMGRCGMHRVGEMSKAEMPMSVASSLLPGNPPAESVMSAKASVKTAASPVMQHPPVGTHSPAEVADITRAITDSFLSVDEGWINSIDPITTHQTACISNGRWNAGACALVVFTVQRLDWTRSSAADLETDCGESGCAGGGEDTSHNKDAARRRKLDYATNSKSVGSLSTLSSTSTTVSVQESEITETEDDDDDVSDIFGPRRRGRRLNVRDDPHHRDDVVISAPGGCNCHYYRPHDAMLYTAHVGDCRAVMLGSAPPRTIKVRPEGEGLGTLDVDSHPDSSDDYSCCESEELSSSDRDSDSSDEDADDDERTLGAAKVVTDPAGVAVAGEPGAGTRPVAYMTYLRGPAKRQCRRRTAAAGRRSHSLGNPDAVSPYAPVLHLGRAGSFSSCSEESEVESDESTLTTAPPPGPKRKVRGGHHSNNQAARRLSPRRQQDLSDIAQKLTAPDTHRPPGPSLQLPPLLLPPPPPLPLSSLMRPIDLTTDHSAYNPAEVTAVLRRCNNAPRAISSASGGGIKRVAGSLAVTRALGDAYLKTPRLSFFPYKRHAPYITARPEVNCRLLSKGGGRVLILATDGVWERCSGDDVLRWVRSYYNERIAGAENHSGHKRKRGSVVSSSASGTTTPHSSGSSTGGRGGGARTWRREYGRSASASASTHNNEDQAMYSAFTVSDVIIRRVLNRVRRARNMPNLRSLTELPKGRARRSKHDDITAMVIVS